MEPSFFAPLNNGAFQTLLRKVMEQCRLCLAKSQRQSFRSVLNNKSYLLKKITDISEIFKRILATFQVKNILREFVFNKDESN